MIKYQLQCSVGHEFDAWFRNSDDYDRQEREGMLECPVCGDVHVRKAIMAPAVSRSAEKGRLTPAERRSVAAAMAAMRRHVETTHDYVGDKFPEEARKIHYGEADERQIYGEATLSEAKELVDEGVPIAPVPQPTPKPKTNEIEAAGKPALRPPPSKKLN